MNAQTPGPLWLDDDQCLAAGSGDTYRTVAEVNGPNRADRLAERDANRRLLAASFNTFDKAGRALGVDAAALAEGIDLAALIGAAREALDAMEDEWPITERPPSAAKLRAALSTLPALP